LNAPRTIYAKGLLLISIPLVLELAFGLSLFCLQHYYQDKLKRERVASEIIFHANEIWINCSEIMLLEAAYSFLGAPKQPIVDRTNLLHAEYEMLAKLVADDAMQTQNVENIRAYTYQAIALTNRLKPLMWKGESLSGLVAGIKSTVDNFKAAYDLAYPILPAIQNFAKPEFIVYGPMSIREVERAARMVDQVVLVSLAGSTIAASLLFIYFIRTIKRGVTAIVENTERFRRGEELNPAIGGGDELAQVDAAFHEMTDEIKEAERTKQAVLAVISHDLRSPLTSVLACFTLLGIHLGETGEATKAAIDQEERSVEQLVRMINDLLDLEKIEAQKLALERKMIPIEKVVEMSIIKVERFADQDGVTIRGASSDAEILADPDWIVRALSNVLLAAINVSARGSFIDTSIVRFNQDVEIRVTFASTIVSADTLSAQFDRYQKRESGFGLELPLSMEIIKLHGGAIGVSSDQAQRLTIWVRLRSTQSQVS